MWSIILDPRCIIPVVFVVYQFVGIRKLYCIAFATSVATVSVLALLMKHIRSINKLVISHGIVHTVLLVVCHFMMVHF